MQRCVEASCVVDGKTIGEIGKGLVIFVGFMKNEEEKSLKYILDKVLGLRIFEDANDKMNLSLLDVDGELLIIPNFTLYGDVRKGKRPSFIASEIPEKAEYLFNNFVSLARGEYENKVEIGQFQSDMKINVLNDGPVTILLDSEREF